MSTNNRLDATALRTVDVLWDLWRNTSTPVRERVAARATEDAAALADTFYDTLLADPHAAAFLSHGMVSTRLRPSMARWITQVFGVRSQSDAAAVVERNLDVGLVHARINMPLTLINTGMRVIKKDLARRLVASGDLSADDTAESILFIGDVLDTLADTMHEAYIGDMLGNVRHEQSLKMFMTGQSLALETERLKASLYDWLRTVMVSLYEPGNAPPNVPPLTTSDFGLWLNHKAELTFGPVPELESLRTLMNRATDRVEDALGRAAVDAAFIRRLDQDVTEIAFLLSSVTGRAMEMESGRDSLTRLLTRRFMPSILQREVAMSVRHGKRFAVLLVDGDHFKRINDTHGHDAGDKALTAIAETLMAQVRAGDFVFRYGGEEFLVLLTEMDEKTLVQKAEQIRRAVEKTPVSLGEGRTLPLTVSVGAALHDGHPDYEQVVKAADAALYRAKAAGRNRVCLSGAPEAATAGAPGS